ncbi:MAG: prepilin-type N-terminal cleavage/methylation domain-containing protein [Candidatus Latescibacterota bacterium]
MFKPKRTNSGFTLIEVIVVLILVGVLSAITGMGIVTGLQGYLFARENAPTAQKAQLAMARMSRELVEISGVTAVTANSIVFQNLTGDRALALVGTTDKVIKVIDGTTPPTADTGDVLVDKVGSFTLSYKKADGNPWTFGADDASLLTCIWIDLGVSRPESGAGTINFSTKVNPRNTGTFNVPVE